MRHVRVVSATLLALAALSAGDAAPAVAPPQVAKAAVREYTTQPSRTIAMDNADPKLVAKAALFVTSDGGASWSKNQEVAVPVGAAAVPAFTFVAPKDGVFGLWTVATSRDGRAEPEPVAGAAPKLELVVDRAAPALGRLDATLGGIADGQADLAVSWQISDANLGADPVAIEISTDQGKSFAARHRGPVDGVTALKVPTGSAEVQVRLVAHDLAGNVLTSPAKSVALPIPPKPADPEAALAAAVAALPAPADLGVAGRSGSPIVSDGSNPLATPAEAKPVAADDKPAAGAAPTAEAAPPARPAAEPEVVANRDVETAYARAAGAPVEAPRGRQADGAGEATASDLPAEPAAAPRATAANESEPFLVGAEASALLDKALSAELAGDVNGALAMYMRLHRSSQAKSALEGEFALLRRIGDHASIVAIVDQLPPELRTDAVRLHAARANLVQGNNEAAATWAARVRASAGEAREAMLVLAKALNGLGRKAEARRILGQLASGDDEIAAQARAEQ